MKLQKRTKLSLYLAIIVFLVGIQSEMASQALAGSLVGWGWDANSQTTPPAGNDFVVISAGDQHSLALKSDGSIVGWGWNNAGQATPPDGNDFVAIAAGGIHSLGLKTDGSIVGWGENFFGQATPPASNDFVAIAAGRIYSLGLKAEGSIVGWGGNFYGQATPPAGNDFVAIAAGSEHSLALKADGSMVGWGWDLFGQATPPAGNEFVAIAAGEYHSLALKADGSIVGWGDDFYGQATPRAGNDFVAIAAGSEHSLALKADGSIVGWGDDFFGQATPPAGNHFVALAGGWLHSLAIRRMLWYVDDDAPNDPCHGNPDYSDPCEDGTIEHPFDAIQEAIEVAFDGDTVVVLDGTYTGTGNRDIDYGGRAITVRSVDPEDPCVVAATIIDCQQSGRGFYFHSGEDGNSLVNGLTITNGFQLYRGGGIYCHQSSPAITNCTISNCQVDGHGGAINCNEASPQVTNCAITGNRSSGWGGGISFYRSSARVVSCRITGNWVDFGDGGGIECEESSPTVRDCVITGNASLGQDGGGISFRRGFYPAVSDCIISGNSAQGGGGIYCNASSPTITRCEISDNVGFSVGGVILMFGSTAAINNCLIMGNNSTHGAGGISCWDCSPTFNNCTIVGNASGEDAGGLVCGGASTTTTIANSILWNRNLVEIMVNPSDPPHELLITHSDVKGNWLGEGNIDVDPCFVNPDSNDYHLRPGSPCIDAGDPNYVLEPNYPTDLDGNPRVVGGRVDMGAYEFVTPVEVAMRFTPQALNPGSKGNWVKAHFVLPEEYTIEDVDANSPAKITEPFEPDIDSNYVDVFINDDNLVEVEAAFERSVFCEAGISDEAIEVMVIGSFTSGQQFFGTDTIKITTNYLEFLGILASHWLEEECDRPDWCEGADLDQDSIVNFVDFALFDGCCIEVVAE